MIPSQEQAYLIIGKNIKNSNENGARFGRSNVREKIKKKRSNVREKIKRNTTDDTETRKRRLNYNT